MELSILLAKAFGIFFLLVALALVFNKEDYKGIFMSIVEDPGHVFLWGLLGSFLGTLFILSHNIWDTGWQTLITLMAWAMFIKGILSILFPGLVYEVLKKANLDNMYLLEFSTSVILGIVLSYFGFGVAAMM
ncbi:hypothetical protein H6758_03540 [Candidatus Nomurabacteria bacterium]|nr:hypothetical protein [Candidatus Nomurabacteria bacterium]